jgi:ferredoxin-NADP reductase
MSSKTDLIEVRISALTREAQRINAYELRRLDGGELPAFKAGAHVDVHLPNGLVRNYSLVNPEGETLRYVLGVNLDRNSRGGSKYLHEQARVGEILRISEPRNNFPLQEAAFHSVFIAGGIGITPLWCMIQRLSELGRHWELHYCARTRQSAAFLQEITEKAAHSDGALYVYFDEEPDGDKVDIDRIVAGSPEDAHLYCCGPAGMLQAFEAAVKDLPEERVHVEYFSNAAGATAQGGFVVELARSGRTVAVPAGISILNALLTEGVDVPHSCTEGVCGTCETKVLEGTPEHLDMVLTEQERAANKSMMICCSGCKGGKLVLDL